MLWPVDYVWIADIAAVMGGMWWVGYRMEPHWVSRDGTRILCTAQELDGGAAVGRPRETRLFITPDGVLYATQKRMLRRRSSAWTLIGKSPDPPRRLQVYVAQQRADGHAVPAHLAIRIPARSRCIPMLDALLTKAAVTASTPAPESAAPASPPDRD